MSPSASKPTFGAIKSDVDTFGWKDEYREALEDYIIQVHMLINHSYTFCKFVFLSELTLNDNFQYAVFSDNNFFKEVFLSLTNYSRSTNPSKDEQHYKELIQKYLSSYLELADWTPPEITSAERAAQHVALSIQESYINNINNQMERSSRRAINMLLRADERKQSYRKEFMDQGLEGEELKDRIYKDIIEPIRKFKDEILAGNFQNANTVLGFDCELLLQVLRAYPSGYQFKDNYINADVRENPYVHFLPLFRVIKLLEQKDSKDRTYFLLHRRFIPCYTRIDTGILCTSILKMNPDKFQDQIQPWELVVNMQHEVFKESNGYRFNGTVVTDGVGARIIKDFMPQEMNNNDSILTEDEIQNSTPYIHQMLHADLVKLNGKCVLVDPGTRDLLFITNNGDYKKPLEDAKKETPQVLQAQFALFRYHVRNNCLEDFIQHTRTRGTVSKVLYSYHANFKVKDSHGDLYGCRQQKLILSRRKKEALVLMIEEMKNAFGFDSVFVFGDWSTFGSQKKKLQDHIREILQENGLKIAYVDEFGSSKVCPSCHQYSLKKVDETFDVDNQDEVLQPEKSGTNLLRCTSSACKNSQGKRNVWDRNFAAALNFRIILFSLRKLGIYPPQFQRPQFSFNAIC